MTTDTALWIVACINCVILGFVLANLINGRRS